MCPANPDAGYLRAPCVSVFRHIRAKLRSAREEESAVNPLGRVE